MISHPFLRFAYVGYRAQISASCYSCSERLRTAQQIRRQQGSDEVGPNRLYSPPDLARHEEPAKNLAQANKLSRTYAALLEALNRHRGKGQQKVTVEHVHVHAGGQAVVGMVAASSGQEPGGGDQAKEQPQAKQIAHAPEPALPSPDAGRDALPIARDAKRALPNARRKGAGRTKGQ